MFINIYIYTYVTSLGEFSKVIEARGEVWAVYLVWTSYIIVKPWSKSKSQVWTKG